MRLQTTSLQTPVDLVRRSLHGRREDLAESQPRAHGWDAVISGILEIILPTNSQFNFTSTESFHVITQNTVHETHAKLVQKTQSQTQAS